MSNSLTDNNPAADKRKAVEARMKEQYVVVPVTPSEAMWGGLARDIMMWMDCYSDRTPYTLKFHFDSIGREIPQWMLDEPEIKNMDHAMSKGTRCALIWKAMVYDALLEAKQ